MAPRAMVTPSTRVRKIISRQSSAVNRSPLPNTTPPRICSFTSRRKSHELCPSYRCRTVRPCTVTAATPRASAPSSIRQKQSRLSSLSSRPRRILSVTGTRQGTAAHARQDFDRLDGPAEEISAAALAHHFTNRAAEVHVDHVEPGLDQLHRCRCERLRRAPHQLCRARMVRRRYAKISPGLIALRHIDHELVEQHLADGVSRSHAPRNDPSRPIAVSAHGRERRGKIDRHTAEWNGDQKWEENHGENWDRPRDRYEHPAGTHGLRYGPRGPRNNYRSITQFDWK